MSRRRCNTARDGEVHSGQFTVDSLVHSSRSSQLLVESSQFAEFTVTCREFTVSQMKEAADAGPPQADRLAEGAGEVRGALSLQCGLSPGGAIWDDRAASKGGRLGGVEHRGRIEAPIAGRQGPDFQYLGERGCRDDVGPRPCDQTRIWPESRSRAADSVLRRSAEDARVAVRAGAGRREVTVNHQHC